MTEAKTVRRQPAKLSFADGEVMVTPKDRDVFFISATRATEACREAIQKEEVTRRFESDFLVPLHEWCESRSDHVRACYLPLPAGSIRVFVITASPKYDFELGEQLAALELGFANAGWRLSVSQIPAAEEDSLGTFFSPDGALEVYAQRGSAPEESGV
jgi:hypothetical protein